MSTRTKGSATTAANTEDVARRPPNHLRELREAAGLSRTELAFRLGVGEATVVRWELRTAGIPDRRKVELARILNTSVDELMAGWPEQED